MNKRSKKDTLIYYQGPDDKKLKAYTPEAFEKKTGIHYLLSLSFHNEKIQSRILQQCRRALKEDLLEKEAYTFGKRYASDIECHKIAPVYIRWVSKEMGHGLFAKTKIVKGSYIGEYVGVVVPHDIPDCHNPYCFNYPTSDIPRFRKHVIDAEYKSNELRYANHSSSPNTETRGVMLDGLMYVIAIASQDIPAHKQITYDYSEEYWKLLERTPQKIL